MCVVFICHDCNWTYRCIKWQQFKYSKKMRIQCKKKSHNNAKTCSHSVQTFSAATYWHVLLKPVCVLAFINKSIVLTHTHTHARALCGPLFLFLLPKLRTSKFISVLLISVRNHAVHLIGQVVLKARHRLAGSANYQVGGGALDLVHAHVTGFGDLPLGKAHKLRVPCVDAETLGDQDLQKNNNKKKQKDNDVRERLYHTNINCVPIIMSNPQRVLSAERVT